MKRFFYALSGLSLMVAATGCCCGASQCCGYPTGGGCPNGACGVGGGGPVYQNGAFLPGTTTIQAAAPTSKTTASVPSTYQSNYPMTAMVDPISTF